MNACSIQGCPKPVLARSFCGMHYQRFRKNGDPNVARPDRPEFHVPSFERFWAKVAEGSDGCWTWTGSRTAKGYGTVGQGGKTRFVHRVAYEWLVADIPDGLELDHLCRNRACVNPDHLEPVTHRVNVNRGRAVEASRERARAITHCPAGHPYTLNNTALDRGKRSCRTCKAQRERERRARIKAAS